VIKIDCYFLDASALVKRYMPENGSELINQLIENVQNNRLFLLIITFGEVISIFVRKRNGQQILDTEYCQAVVDFNNEFLNNTEITIQSVTDDLVRNSLSLIESYSINATDAIILECALGLDCELRAKDDDLVLVTTDIRLSNAAKSSGLKVWNLETDSQLDLEL